MRVVLFETRTPYLNVSFLSIVSTTVVISAILSQSKYINCLARNQIKRETFNTVKTLQQERYLITFSCKCWTKAQM